MKTTKMVPTLDIIIVNRNSGRLLHDCLASIEAADKRGLMLSRISIVDDVSTDSSLQGTEGLALPIQIIRNPIRRGYGASCNLAVASSRAEYLLFLNADVCLSSESLRVPLLYVGSAENEQIGIMGIKLLENSGEVSRSCARFPTIGRSFAIMLGLDRVLPRMFLGHQMRDWDHMDTREVDQVMGAFMMMRRTLFEQLGGYDERFFVYMEDLDLSLRAKQRGFKSMYLSTAYAYHKGGGTARQAWAESLFFKGRSCIQFGFKHFSRAGAILIMFGTLLIEPFTRLVWAFAGCSMREVVTTAQAYYKLWCWVPSFVKDG